MQMPNQTNSTRGIRTLNYKDLNKLSQMHMDESQTTTSFRIPVLATATFLSLWSNHEMKYHHSGSPSFVCMCILRVNLQEVICDFYDAFYPVILERPSPQRVLCMKGKGAAIAVSQLMAGIPRLSPEGDTWKDEYYFFFDNNWSNNFDGAQAVMIHKDDFVSAMQSLQLKHLCISMAISLVTFIQHSYLKTEAIEVGPDSPL